MLTERYLYHLKKNFMLAYPVMLSQLGHMMVGVADSMMVGHLGALQLAGASLATIVFNLLLMFGIGVSYAITPLVASADGEKNTEKSTDLLRHAIMINLSTGIILFLIVKIAGNGLFYLNQPEDVVTAAIPYLNILTLSIIPLMVFQTFRQFAEGLSFTRQPMLIVIASNVLNIILNYLFIYGKLGCPQMGLNGAAWASFIARCIMAIWIALYIYKGKAFTNYRKGFAIGRYSKLLIRKILSLGIPAGLQFVFEVGAFSFAVIMIGWLGTKPLAAHQIAISLAAVSYMMASGLSSAATIRIGNQLGKKDKPALKDAAYTIYAMVVIFMLITAAIFISGRYFLPSLFINDIEVIELAGSLMVIAGFFQVSDGLQVVGLGALRGLADVKVPTFLTFIAYWVLALPIGYFMAFHLNMGPKGVWYGLLIGLSIVAIVMLWRFNYLTNKLDFSDKKTD